MALMVLLTRWRRLPRAARWLWAALALLLGLVSFPLLLCLSGLPVLVRCGSCGKAGLVTAGACPECGAARQVPARNGT